MRIPQVILENLYKRYKKHRKESIEEAPMDVTSLLIICL